MCIEMYLWELSLGRTYTFKKFSQNFHTRAGVFTVQLYINIYLRILAYLLFQVGNFNQRNQCVPIDRCLSVQGQVST